MRRNRFWRRLLAIFFPERCHFCGQVILPETELCKKCSEEEKRLSIGLPICPFCGREKASCRCQKHRQMFERNVSAYTYEGLAKQGVIRFKRLSVDMDATFYAAKLAQTVRCEYAGVHFDGIVPVPMNHNQIKKGDKSPTLQLAKALSKELKTPVADILVKIYETRPQKTLQWRERQGNLLGVFDVKEGVSPADKRYLLVDDVITSGATLHECAKMLKIYGAEQVLAATIAATRLDDDRNKR